MFSDGRVFADKGVSGVLLYRFELGGHGVGGDMFGVLVDSRQVDNTSLACRLLSPEFKLISVTS